MTDVSYNQTWESNQPAGSSLPVGQAEPDNGNGKSKKLIMTIALIVFILSMISLALYLVYKPISKPQSPATINQNTVALPGSNSSQ